MYLEEFSLSAGEINKIVLEHTHNAGFAIWTEQKDNGDYGWCYGIPDGNKPVCIYRCDTIRELFERIIQSKLGL